MFKLDIDENYRLSINRGDSGTIKLTTATAFFSAGDSVIFKAGTQNNYTDVKLTKTFIVASGASATEFDIELEPTDTKSLCEAFATGVKIFWYEISVENSLGTKAFTVLGADENGSKELWIFPEGETVD